jgi:hypothetical protein
MTRLLVEGGDTIRRRVETTSATPLGGRSC